MAFVNINSKNAILDDTAFSRLAMGITYAELGLAETYTLSAHYKLHIVIRNYTRLAEVKAIYLKFEFLIRWFPLLLNQVCLI